jgi:hypothetical protein
MQLLVHSAPSSGAGSAAADEVLHIACYGGPQHSLWETNLSDEDFAAHVRTPGGSLSCQLAVEVTSFVGVSEAGVGLGS